jgi:hypothetical protein
MSNAGPARGTRAHVHFVCMVMLLASVCLGQSELHFRPADRLAESLVSGGGAAAACGRTGRGVMAAYTVAIS